MTGRNWEAGTGIDQLDDLIDGYVTEAMKSAMDYETWFTIGYFPMTYYPRDGMTNGEPPSEPLVFRIYSDDAGFLRDFDLWAELEENIKACEEDGSYAKGLSRIAPRLRELADRLDAAVKGAPKARMRIKQSHG